MIEVEKVSSWCLLHYCIYWSYCLYEILTVFFMVETLVVWLQFKWNNYVIEVRSYLFYGHQICRTTEKEYATHQNEDFLQSFKINLTEKTHCTHIHGKCHGRSVSRYKGFDHGISDQSRKYERRCLLTPGDTFATLLVTLLV